MNSWVFSLDSKVSSIEDDSGILVDPFTEAILNATKGNNWEAFIHQGLKDLVSFPIVNEKPFESKTKYSFKERSQPNGTHVVYFKGAPEILLNKSKYIFQQGKSVILEEEMQLKLTQILQEMASNGFRMIAFAQKEKTLEEFVEEELVFTGMMAFEDSIREEVLNSIQICQRAGIKVKVKLIL